MSHGAKQSLTQKYLPADCWKWLSIKTSFGTTITDCVRSAIENPDSNVGLYAPGIIFFINFQNFSFVLNFVLILFRSRSL